MVRWLVPLLLLSSASAIAQPALSVQAKSAIIVCDRSGAVLFEKDADALRYPASTTKILTALLMLEKLDLDTMIAAPEDTEQITGASLHLRPGEKVSARNLLWAVMLRSANDACHAVAHHMGGSDEGFAAMMNERAREIGLTKTRFHTPHGLPNRQHVTTARELSMIAREAMKNPEFRQIADTRKVRIERTVNQEDRWLISKNAFLDQDPTHDGIKTGFTNDAGQCFVGSATRNGWRVITVILDSTDWKADQKAMVDWAFKHFERTPARLRGETVGSAELPAGTSPVQAKIDADVPYAHPKGQEPRIRVDIELKEGLQAPVSEGQPIGEATFSDSKGWSETRPIFAAKTVSAKPLQAALSNPWAFALVAALGGAAIVMRRKAQRLSGRSWR